MIQVKILSLNSTWDDQDQELASIYGILSSVDFLRVLTWDDGLDFCGPRRQRIFIGDLDRTGPSHMST